MKKPRVISEIMPHKYISTTNIIFATGFSDLE